MFVVRLSKILQLRANTSRGDYIVAMIASMCFGRIIIEDMTTVGRFWIMSHVKWVPRELSDVYQLHLHIIIHTHQSSIEAHSDDAVRLKVREWEDWPIETSHAPSARIHTYICTRQLDRFTKRVYQIIFGTWASAWCVLRACPVCVCVCTQAASNTQKHFTTLLLLQPRASI